MIHAKEKVISRPSRGRDCQFCFVVAPLQHVLQRTKTKPFYLPANNTPMSCRSASRCE